MFFQKTIVIIIVMIIDTEKITTPTKLQPKLFSVVRDLKSNPDYCIITGKNNEPVCALVSLELLESQNFNFEKPKKNNFSEFEKDLMEEMEIYYKNTPKEEEEMSSLMIDDGIL